jgi:hypothetical protein
LRKKGSGSVQEAIDFPPIYVPFFRKTRIVQRSPLGDWNEAAGAAADEQLGDS